MNPACGLKDGELLAVAEGEILPLVQEHLVVCAACASEFNRLKAIVQSLRLPSFEPPQELVSQAKSMVMGRPFHRARFVLDTLGFANVRGDSDSFQVVFEQEPYRVRLLHQKNGARWSISGRLEPASAQVVRDGIEIEQDSAGRFRYECDSLLDCGFLLLDENQVIEIPAASQSH